ncbi:MAG: DUF2096 family protein [Thermoguttaceae bacterium]|jgi:hypothetical protein
MGGPTDRSAFDFEILKRYGAKWAVLAAMTTHMVRKGIPVPSNSLELLRNARTKIVSGCFSPCEVSCELAQVEGQVFSQCHLLEEQDFKDWSDLLGEAMQGKLDYQRILGIPALDPIKNDCVFLACSCSSST